MSKKHPVDGIPSGEEWWKESNREAFIEAYEELVGKGFEANHALGFLTELYWATAGEYGE